MHLRQICKTGAIQVVVSARLNGLGRFMMTVRPRRSALYMPGSNSRAIEKARSLPVDAVILDLEDSVAPEAKETARKQVGDAVSAGGFGPREIVVRINGLDTEWWL